MPEPIFCSDCSLVIEKPMTRCHWCIAERSDNFRTLVDGMRGLAWEEPSARIAKSVRASSKFYDPREASRSF